jgi:hypothetical protein
MTTPHQIVARFLVSILTMFGFGGIGLLPAADDVATPAAAAVASSEPLLTATGFGPEQQALIDWAVDLFRQADLPLPPVDFVHEPSRDACKGRRGSHTVDQGRSIIRICTDEAGLADQILFVHELAHAWDRNALTDERRAAFMALRGLHTWRGSDPTGEDWLERGAEHAAEIMTWGLLDWPMMVVFIPDNTCADLLAGYQTLTGESPLHGFTDYC